MAFPRGKSAYRLRLGIVAGLVAVAAAVLPATVGAHVQVTPSTVAPLDPVLFTVLVPNESQSGTTKVELQVPEGIFPFSFADTPGWERTMKLAPDQSIESIVWTGELASDGLGEFSFLATTPEQEGEIAWKSIQTYADGTVVRWIGDADSEEPAAITTVSAGAARQNAGGEGAEAEEPGAATTTAAAVPSDEADDEEDEDEDQLPLILGIVAAILAAIALVVALTSRRRAQS